MNMIEGDQVVRCERAPVAPGPANRNPGIVEVMDRVVQNAIVGRLAEPDADRAMEHLAAIVNLAIANLVGPRLLRAIVPKGGFAELDPARTQVPQVTPGHVVALAAPAQLQRVISQIGKGAAYKYALPQALTPDRAGHADSRLRKAADFGRRRRPGARRIRAGLPGDREIPFCVRKRQPLKMHTLDELRPVGLALDPHNLR